MKIYSETLNKFYDTVEACEKAEAEAKVKAEEEARKKEEIAALAKEKKEKEAAERKAFAAEVEEARKAYSDACKTCSAAQKAYKEKLSAFVDKYHTYHYSTSNPEEIPTLFDIFDKLFKF